MTRADSTQLLGRSRDTLVGAAPLPVPTPTRPLMRVVLRLWGETAADVQDAERAALRSLSAGLWDIRDVIPSKGAPCPIPPRDVLAVGQGADYGHAWAAYPVVRG